MGSLFIMITVPSVEHEKSLWLEKYLGIQKEKNTNSLTTEHHKLSSDRQVSASSPKPSAYTLLDRSFSEESVLTTQHQHTNKERAQSDTNMPNTKNRIPMVKCLENCLKELKIPNAIWVVGSQGRYHQVSFCTPAGEQCELIVHLLAENNIGVELNSTVSILPCSLYYEGKELSPGRVNRFASPKRYVKELTTWERFIHSVRDRLMVAQVVEGVKNNADFTFDFLILLVIASFTAAVGLVENSVVILVASMLISPLMGPVMASTFGFVTKDWKLQKIGVLNELMGLLVCVFIGFLYGLIIGYFSCESPDVTWPTPEMVSRGDLRSLWVGALIALMSGAAVAIAVLGDYSGSFTGVAISASLMPPAVNAGLLWATAAVGIAFSDLDSKRLSALKSEDPVRELLLLGALSLALTFINIACIFIMGIIVLKIKEVTPQGSKNCTKFILNDSMQMPQGYKCRLSQSVDRMECGIAANREPDNRFDLNMSTWSPYGVFQDAHRMHVSDLVAMWQDMKKNPPNTLETPCAQHFTEVLQGATSPNSKLPKVAHIWGVSPPEF